MSSHTPAAAKTSGGYAGLADFLARLGGADSTVLSNVPSARGRFIQMGLVLLSTSGLAVVSMTFALNSGMKLYWVPALAFGIGWGFIILNIDRMLVMSMKSSGVGVRSLVGMVLPRLVMAALLGIVISTPLVLKVFEPEIQTMMRETNAQAVNELGQTRAASPAAKRLGEVQALIAIDEGILRGNVPGITTPGLETARQGLADAQSNLTAKRQVADTAYAKMTCELDGSNCAGASGKRGDGPRYKALKRIYDTAAADLTVAQRAVATAQTSLDSAATEATVTDKTKVEAAQVVANKALPGLRTEQGKLQSTLAGTRGRDDKVLTTSTGLLAQIEALEALGRKSPAANQAHLAMAGLFFMIELLPVLVKILISLGPTSLYDRISELQDSSTYDDAQQRRNSDRHRIEHDSKKVQEIEDDMRDREKDLGVRANKHVATEMEKILDVALHQWSANVSQTLAGPGVGPGPLAGGGTRNGTSSGIPAVTLAPPNAVPPVGMPKRFGVGVPVAPVPVVTAPQSTGPAVRSKFNLPNGTKI